MTGDEAGSVRGVRAATLAEDWPLLLETWPLALKTDETVLASELVEPMPFNKSPESRASESEEDMLAEGSTARTCGCAMHSDGL